MMTWLVLFWSAANAVTPLSSCAERVSERPAAERLVALRDHPAESWTRFPPRVIDALFGLDVDRADEILARERHSARYAGEDIWYAPGAGQQSPWSALHQAVANMHLQPGELVVDLGSGLGRLGLLLGVLRPDVRFLGLELVEARVLVAREAATNLGFHNVRFAVANLADDTPLPPADHFYMFNPTNAKTSAIITRKLLELAKTKAFKVHLLTMFQAPEFYRAFKQTDGGWVAR